VQWGDKKELEQMAWLAHAALILQQAGWIIVVAVGEWLVSWSYLALKTRVLGRGSNFMSLGPT